ncbi:hypothetical protein BASA50_007587 [Batrachochytrium salamandrivorans]|uniref:Velvet domain-containing protein n=1 Tax=Batrachochytrium salamandrivorans TaxID=1357716 RepID=A0ABQ8F6M0_9FUNG|nr:hypothetical protein BASA50_007587 [Batrachochytrium salamandrivorans]KAH9269519.1 hypothetical protein BASA83_008469 [Batrachochytrium salamandrivorans]
MDFSTHVLSFTVDLSESTLSPTITYVLSSTTITTSPSTTSTTSPYPPYPSYPGGYVPPPPPAPGGYVPPPPPPSSQPDVIAAALLQVSPRKAPDDDGISTAFYQAALYMPANTPQGVPPTPFACALLRVCGQVFASATIPRAWLCASIVSIDKKDGDPLNPGDWAISETCITSSKFRFTVPGFDVIQHPATGPGRRGISLGIPSWFGGHERNLLHQQ